MESNREITNALSPQNTTSLTDIDNQIDRLFELCMSKGIIVNNKIDFNEVDSGLIEISAALKNEINIDINVESIIISSEKSKNISTIKITNKNEEWHQNKHIDYFIIFTDKKSVKKYFCIHAHKEADDLIKEITANVPDKQAEIIYKKKYRAESNPYSKIFWSSGWDKDRTHINYYDKLSDKAIIKSFYEFVLSQEFLFSLNIHVKELIIFDAGAGKGRLAEKLITFIKEQQIKLHYIVLEPEKQQCEIAKKILNPLQGDNCRISYIDQGMKEYFTSPLYQEHKGTVHCIISSGGPLNHRVVSQTEAKENIQIMREMLTEGGRLIATGLSPLLITKKDFMKDNSFSILKTSARTDTQESDNSTLIQFYILEKNPLRMIIETPSETPEPSNPKEQNSPSTPKQTPEFQFFSDSEKKSPLETIDSSPKALMPSSPSQDPAPNTIIPTSSPNTEENPEEMEMLYL